MASDVVGHLGPEKFTRDPFISLKNASMAAQDRIVGFLDNFGSCGDSDFVFTILVYPV